MDCPRCAHPGSPDDAFCSQCGAPRLRSCPACSQQWPLDADFCSACGTRISPEPEEPEAPARPGPERRTITVLLADLAGYTALNEALDPEEVAGILEEIKTGSTRVVESHGGIVNQFVGDQVTALFGVPVAHDDDPLRAVAAAREVHEVVARVAERRLGDRFDPTLSMHTAIETGLVIAEERDDAGGVYAITGGAMDRAESLVGLSTGGALVLGDAAREQIADYFETEPVSREGGPPGHRLLGAKSTRSRFEAARARGLTPLTGRRYELDRLNAAYRDTREGRGHLIAIVGEPGVGKSRLVHEFRESIDREEAYVFYGRCQTYGDVTAYLPFLQAFRDGLGMVQEESPEDVERRVVRVVRDLDPELERYVPIYLHVLSVQSKAYPIPPEMRDEALPRAIQDSVVAMNRRLSLQRPVVLHLEDWHWVDAASEATMMRFAREIQDARILVILDYRPHYQPRRVGFDPELIRLGPLPPREATSLIARCLEAEKVAPELSREIQERTGGNPLFIEEICSDLLQQGAVRRDGDTVSADRPLSALGLTDTVQAVVRGRIDRLEGPVRSLLRVASVIGREFSNRLLEAVAGPGPPLAERIAELERLDLVQPLESGPEPGSRFKHVTTQQVAYDTLLHRRRKELHARVAAAIEQQNAHRIDEHVEELARHYALADDDDRAAQYLTLAGRKAARSYALGEARRHYRNAIDRLDPETPDDGLARQRIGAVIRWAEVCVYDPAHEQIEQLVWARGRAERMERMQDALRCDYWVAWIYYAIGDQVRAIEEGQRAVERVRPLGNDELLGQTLCNLGQCHVIGREAETARQLLGEGMVLRRRAADAGGYALGGTFAYALSQLGLLEADGGNFEVANRWLDEALALVRNIGRRSAEASILTTRGIVDSLRGDARRALATALEFREFAEHMAAPYLYATSESLEGLARFHQGEVDEGIGRMRSAIAKLEDCGALLTMAWSLGVLAEALALQGQGGLACSYAKRALERAAAGDRLGEGFALRAQALGEAQRGGGSLETARVRIEDARAQAEREGNAAKTRLAELFAAEIELVADEPGRAERAFEAVLPGLEQLEMTSYAARARRSLRRAQRARGSAEEGEPGRP